MNFELAIWGFSALFWNIQDINDLLYTDNYTHDISHLVSIDSLASNVSWIYFSFFPSIISWRFVTFFLEWSFFFNFKPDTTFGSLLLWALPNSMFFRSSLSYQKRKCLIWYVSAQDQDWSGIWLFPEANNKLVHEIEGKLVLLIMKLNLSTWCRFTSFIIGHISTLENY